MVGRGKSSRNKRSAPRKHKRAEEREKQRKLKLELRQVHLEKLNKLAIKQLQEARQKFFRETPNLVEKHGNNKRQASSKASTKKGKMLAECVCLSVCLSFFSNIVCVSLMHICVNIMSCVRVYLLHIYTVCVCVCVYMC